MVILGIDYGEKRVGVAICDPEEIIATPLTTLRVNGRRSAVRQVAQIAAERGAELIVVGMPLNMDSSVGPKARDAAAFAALLADAVDCEVKTWDERLSTFAAEDAMRDAGLSWRKRKSRVDKVAAQVILRSYMEANRPGAPPG